MDTETTMNLMGEDAANIGEALGVYDKDRALTDDLLEALQGEDREIPYRLSDAFELAMDSGETLRKASDNFKNIADRINQLIDDLRGEVVNAIQGHRQGIVFPYIVEDEGRLWGESICTSEAIWNEWPIGQRSEAGECQFRPMVLIPTYEGEEVDTKEIIFRWPRSNLFDAAVDWSRNIPRLIESILSDAGLRDFAVENYDGLNIKLEKIYGAIQAKPPASDAQGKKWREDDFGTPARWSTEWTARTMYDYGPLGGGLFGPEQNSVLHEAWESAIESGDEVIAADEAPSFLLVSIPIKVLM